MKKIKHLGTEVSFYITKETSKTVYMTVIENPKNVPGLKIGMKQKTTPNAIKNQFIEL